jgi:hemerythrin-like domain-containing protein
MALILHDNLIEKDEQNLLKQLVGEQFAGKAMTFVREHGKQSALNKLSESIQSLRNTSSSTRQKYIETVSVFANVINLNIDDIIDLHMINGA